MHLVRIQFESIETWYSSKNFVKYFDTKKYVSRLDIDLLSYFLGTCVPNYILENI